MIGSDTAVVLGDEIFGKPRDEAAEELKPELRDKGLVYFSPIVRLRQLFNLHTNMRPCRAYPGDELCEYTDSPYKRFFADIDAFEEVLVKRKEKNARRKKHSIVIQ